MNVSFTRRQLLGAMILFVLAPFPFKGTNAQSITPANIHSFVSTQVFSTAGGSAVFWTASPEGIVSYDGDRDAPSVSLTAIGSGTITLEALVFVSSTFSYVIVSKEIVVNERGLALTSKPLRPGENQTFSNSLANKFHVTSGNIPGITSFKQGISPATVPEADGRIGYNSRVFSSTGHYLVYCRTENARVNPESEKNLRRVRRIGLLFQLI